MMPSTLEFLEWIYQRCETGNINLRFLGGGAKSEFVPLPLLYENPHKFSPILERYKAFNSYYGIALRNGNNGTKEAITQIPALWVDLDGSPLAKVRQGPWQPSAVVETSPGKFHVYWKLREPADKTEIGPVEGLLKRLAIYFNGDLNATDASRILRIPGTLNHKTTPAFNVTVRSMEEIEYNLSDFDDLPELEQTPVSQSAPKTGDRLKKILECAFLRHCDTDRATLPEPEWYAMVTILARESGGRDLIHSLSRGYAKYSRKETDDKILHSLGAGPLTCQKIKSLWKCGQNCGVVSPVRLAQKKTETALAASATFPREMIGNLAGEFADLYSTYLESPWSFFAFGFLTCLGNLISDRMTLASEIAPQPRLFTVHLGESADDRKSESIKKTVRFFEDALTHGAFKICHGVGSAEGLAKILGESGEKETPKKLTLIYDELKSFVSKATIEGATLLPAVNSFFEGNKFQSATKTHSIDLDDVYLSLLAASTLETFSRMWTPSFLDIGFLNRLWLVRDRGERRFSIPREIPFQEVKGLQRKLGDHLKDIPQERVRLPITEEAREVFDQWYFSLDPGPFSKRLDTYGLRLMIILAANERENSITAEIARAVVTLLRWQLEVRRECDPVDAENNIAKMEEMIRRALAQGSLELRELQRRVHYNRYGLFAWKSGIDNLCRSREVFFDNKAKTYSLMK
jgi:hypothetical protein